MSALQEQIVQKIEGVFGGKPIVFVGGNRSFYEAGKDGKSGFRDVEKNWYCKGSGTV